VNLTTTKQVYRIGVQGMDCRACEQLLLKHVRQIDGITTAYADADEGTLTIFAEADISAERLAASVVEAGFVPFPVEGQPTIVPVVDLAPTEAIVGTACPIEATPAEAIEPAAIGAPAAVTPAPASVLSAPASAITLDATFAIGGMTCASCSAVIEKVLGKTDGVSSAVVNLATEKLAVTYDPRSPMPQASLRRSSRLGTRRPSLASPQLRLSARVAVTSRSGSSA